jgi:hypothetical protein
MLARVYLTVGLSLGTLLATSVFQPVRAQEWTGTDLNNTPCRIGQGFGPYDYTDPIDVKENLDIVERNHFTREVETLVRGITGSVYGDIDYTIRAFPNHHRALYALVNLQLRRDTSLPTRPECYLDRAVRFKPDDPQVYLIYAIYLHRLGELDAALVKYKRAQELAPENPDVHYNMGLLFIDTRDFEQAKEHAMQAYAANYPLSGLRNRLKKHGYSLPE